MRALVPLAALTLSTLALGCTSSKKPPDPNEIEHTAYLARASALELELSKSEHRREELEQRVDQLSKEIAGVKDDDRTALSAKVAELNSRIAALEDRIAVLELRANVAPPSKTGETPADGVRILDSRARNLRAPDPDEVVKQQTVTDGETLSFIYHTVDLAGLIGVEAPLKPSEYESRPERRARAVKEWGEAVVSTDDAARRVKERLESLLLDGELSFRYDATHPEEHREATGRGRLLVYARVKKPSGETLVLNDVLVSEGLALAHGSHERQAEMEKLQETARREKRGFYAK